MPGVAVHLHLAHRALDRWRRRPRTAPFDPSSSLLLNAYRVGAMGPDAGFVPGGFRPLSDLAHALRSGSLARALLEAAREPVQHAFAWGWITHVLADARVHPLVGRAVGELVTGSRATFIDGDRDPVSHIRVETGLDGTYAVSRPELADLNFQGVFDAQSIGFLRAAYRRTYGVAPDRDRLLSSHSRLPRRMAQGLVLTRLSGRSLPPPRAPHEDPGALRRLRARVGGAFAPTAFLFPAPPRPWFVEAVREVEEGFAEAVTEVEESRGVCLRDVNLDTGRPDLSEVAYAGLHRACDYIRGMGGNPPLLPSPVPGAA